MVIRCTLPPGSSRKASMRFFSIVLVALFTVRLKRCRWLSRYIQVARAQVPTDSATRQRRLQQLTVLWATQPPGLHTGDTPEHSDSDESWD